MKTPVEIAKEINQGQECKENLDIKQTQPSIEMSRKKIIEDTAKNEVLDESLQVR